MASPGPAKRALHPHSATPPASGMHRPARHGLARVCSHICPSSLAALAVLRAVLLHLIQGAVGRLRLGAVWSRVPCRQRRGGRSGRRHAARCWRAGGAAQAHAVAASCLHTGSACRRQAGQQDYACLPPTPSGRARLPTSVKSRPPSLGVCRPQESPAERAAFSCLWPGPPPGAATLAQLHPPSEYHLCLHRRPGIWAPSGQPLYGRLSRHVQPGSAQWRPWTPTHYVARASQCVSCVW